ncbi:MAG: adenylosuccinate lyase [Candidatus Moranbacteria bacterium]|nr:adenylosuccinate lyase [Candidatus Moranbacteria bacterium]
MNPQLPKALQPHFHAGVTSYDPGDTSLCLQMRESLEIIISALEELMKVVRGLAILYKATPQIGRTHGIHAEPITFGVKMANYYAELKRGRDRLLQARKTVSVGKLSGAVGMYTLNPEVERLALKELGLRPIIATQIISRDIVAEYMSALALLSSTLEKISTGFRTLSRTEIREVSEYFSATQKGSSAMPHKKNPITFEKITGLTRIVRANLLVALEDNGACWDERSIDNSAPERVIISDSSQVVHYLLQTLTETLLKMNVNPKRMRRNLDLTKGLVFSQEVMMLVAKKSGLPREEAHTLVRDIAVRCFDEDLGFLEELLRSEEIMRHISVDELNGCFSLSHKLRHVDHIFRMVFGESAA